MTAQMNGYPRFLRPVAYQGFPPHLLPAALRDDTELPRLVDGQRL